MKWYNVSGHPAHNNPLHICVLSLSALILLGSHFISLPGIPIPHIVLDLLLSVFCVILFGLLPHFGREHPSVTSK